MFSYLVDDNGEHEKSKDVFKNIVAAKRHNKYKDVLLKKNVWDIQRIGFKVKIIT